MAGPRGFDGAKKVDGVKRHILVDSAGMLAAAAVTVQDRVAFPTLLRRAKRIAPTISHIWLDKGYTGTTVTEAAAKAGISVDIVSGPKPANGFRVQPRRWAVERTNGRINHSLSTRPPPQSHPHHARGLPKPQPNRYYCGHTTAASCSTR